MIMETPGHADMVEQILLVRSWIADMCELEPEYREKYDKLVGRELAGKKGRKKTSNSKKPVIQLLKTKPTATKTKLAPTATKTKLKIKLSKKIN